MVNDELESTFSRLKERLDICDVELGDIETRVSRLYDILETGKLSLDDLASRIK